MRLLDIINNALIGKNYVTHICITSEGLNKILAEFEAEFEDEQLGISDLQEFLGKKICIPVTNIWNHDKEFELLEIVEE